MTMHQDLRMIFKRVTPLQVAINELTEAEFSLLKAETGVEYANSLVSYNKARITRLKSFVKAQLKEQTKEES
jgi:hypothetical protein